MIEAIYVNADKIEGIEKSGANYLMVADDGLNPENWARLKELEMNLSIAINSFDLGGCPADPEAKGKLLERVGKALAFKPKAIWLDHFRFDGHWEAIKGRHIPGLHNDCQFCVGASRAEVISKLANSVMIAVDGNSQVGYFAVPFISEAVPDLPKRLGQEHSIIGQIFDISSPMLYHRMINKPVDYISDYVKWMAGITGKPVLPIIQIKDMSDDLPDEMDEGEIIAAFNEAKREPSVGVAIFWWEHALEKNKIGLVSKLFSE